MKHTKKIDIPANKIQYHASPVAYITYNDETEEYTLTCYNDSENTDIDLFEVYSHTFKNPFINFNYPFIKIEQPLEEYEKTIFETLLNK